MRDSIASDVIRDPKQHQEGLLQAKSLFQCTRPWKSKFRMGVYSNYNGTATGVLRKVLSKNEDLKSAACNYRGLPSSWPSQCEGGIEDEGAGVKFAFVCGTLPKDPTGFKVKKVLQSLEETCKEIRGEFF